MILDKLSMNSWKRQAILLWICLAVVFIVQYRLQLKRIFQSRMVSVGNTLLFIPEGYAVKKGSSSGFQFWNAETAEIDFWVEHENMADFNIESLRDRLRKNCESLKTYRIGATIVYEFGASLNRPSIDERFDTRIFAVPEKNLLITYIGREDEKISAVSHLFGPNVKCVKEKCE